MTVPYYYILPNLDMQLEVARLYDHRFHFVIPFSSLFWHFTIQLSSSKPHLDKVKVTRLQRSEFKFNRSRKSRFIAFSDCS